MEAADAVTLVEAEHTLFVNALKSLKVGSVDRGLEG
jgi:hypothetical protein